MKREYSSLVLRLALGFGFVIAGLDKVLSYDMAQGMFSGMFGSAGSVMLVLAIVVELLFGIALVVGFHTRWASVPLFVLILVATVVTWKLGSAPHFIATLREITVMNTGGGNTPVNYLYLAGLLSLFLSGSQVGAVKPD